MRRVLLLFPGIIPVSLLVDIPASLCESAFCSGFLLLLSPFHCWSVLARPGILPVSLLEIPSTPVSLLGILPGPGRLSVLKVSKV